MNEKKFGIVILGPPGSGKGTQARCLASLFRLKHLDVGRSLRRVAEEKTPLGLQINTLIYKEKTLVPDNLVLEILQNDFEPMSFFSGVILDGAPRHKNQIQGIEHFFQQLDFPILCAISIRVNEKLLVERIKNRYFCPRCIGFYIDGIDVQDATKDLCPKCRYPLERRKDDTAEGVRKRLEIFSQETQLVIEEYRKEKRLIEIDGEDEPDLVCSSAYREVLKMIQEKYENKNTA